MTASFTQDDLTNGGDEETRPFRSAIGNQLHLEELDLSGEPLRNDIEDTSVLLDDDI